MTLEDVAWLELPTVDDSRGSLTSIEQGQDVPFAIERVFYIHGVNADRGGHAHVDTDQVLIAIHGSFSTELFDGRATVTHELRSPTRGLFIPQLVFVTMFDFAPGSVGLVLANTRYDRSRSLRSRADYLAFLRS